MKRFIIISVLLVFAIGMSAQRTNTGSRSASKTTTTSKSTDTEKKSDPAKTETRTRESAPARQNPATETKKETPVRPTSTERKIEPSNNESRNRETPPVRPITTPRQEEKPGVSNRSATQKDTRPVSNTRGSAEKPSGSATRGDQEPQRRVGGSNSATRGNNERNSGTREREIGTRNPGNSRDANVDRSREYTPRTEQVYVERRQTYRTPERTRYARTINHSTTYVHQPVEYRRNYYPYSEPRRVEIIWDVHMYNEYRYLYPHYDYWYYPYGYRINTVSAYDADRFIGEIARIYGRVSDVWYEGQTDEYTLYFGETYPYQDFSVIVPGKQARRYSRHPERYFINRNVAVTGLVSLWEERPEMIVRKRSQLEIYF